MTQKEIEEEWKLVQKAQRNINDFGPLYEKYYESIFGFIYNRTANVDLTAELCSLSFMKAIENIQKYKFQGKPFGGWLFRIALNEVNQYHRKKKVNGTIVLEDSYTETIKDEIGNAEEIEFNLAKLEMILQGLKKDEAELLQLRFFEKMSFKDIGVILEIEENNAKVKVHRLIIKIRDNFFKK